MKKNLIVGQSGGPTAVINGSLYGVVTEAMRHTEEIDEIYGMINGIEGFLNGHMMDMRSLIETNELSLLRTTPGSYLGSCRYKLPEDCLSIVIQQVYIAWYRLFLLYWGK